MTRTTKSSVKNSSHESEYDYLGKSCSATDCTGLIPFGPVDEAQLEAYHELYPFDPPKISGRQP
ncbi:MAG: hypothetical protein SOZ59_12110 [Candidatus Limivivens sp.]|nr:hypothetical protein [Candidatus Limivivens sp.]